MNIKNEIKLFEKHAQKFFTTNDVFAKENDNYIYDEVKFMWDCWITAKKQAVPEGFVVMPVEPTDEMINIYRDKSIAPISTLSVYGYKAMIQEAQK